MTGKGILEALSFIDEQYIEEAENGTLPASAKLRVNILIPLAACLCLILGLNSLGQEETGEAQLPKEEAIQELIQDTCTEQYPKAPSQTELSIAMDEASKASASAVLRIMEWTQEGFTAIVERSDELEAGMMVEVFFSGSVCTEVYFEGLVNAEQRVPSEKDFPSGTLVQVRISDISADKNEIEIIAITLAEP